MYRLSLCLIAAVLFSCSKNEESLSKPEFSKKSIPIDSLVVDLLVVKALLPIRVVHQVLSSTILFTQPMVCKTLLRQNPNHYFHKSPLLC